ncbi:hypothetical protein Tco_1072387 [Tanacetum coccineum]
MLDILNKLNGFTKALFAHTTKIEKPEEFKLEFPNDLLALPDKLSHITSDVAKLKVLDAIPNIMNKVTASLDRFVDAISSASQKDEPSNVPSAGQAATHPAEGEKNTNQVTIIQLFQRRHAKNATNLNKQPCIEERITKHETPLSRL